MASLQNLGKDLFKNPTYLPGGLFRPKASGTPFLREICGGGRSLEGRSGLWQLLHLKVAVPWSLQWSVARHTCVFRKCCNRIISLWHHVFILGSCCPSCLQVHIIQILNQTCCAISPSRGNVKYLAILYTVRIPTFVWEYFWLTFFQALFQTISWNKSSPRFCGIGADCKLFNSTVISFFQSYTKTLK